LLKNATQYRTDKDFRDKVNEIRRILIKKSLNDKDWMEIKKLFNAVLKKLDGIELNDKDFETLKNIIEKERPKIIAYEYYKERINLSTLASSDIAYEYLPKLYQPTSDISNGNGFLERMLRFLMKIFMGITCQKSTS